MIDFVKTLTFVIKYILYTIQFYHITYPKMEKRNFEGGCIKNADTIKQVGSKVSEEILKNIMDCGEDYVNWDNYENLWDDDARHLINNGYWIQVLKHINKFKPTKKLFYMLYESEWLETIALELKRDLKCFFDIWLNASDADSWIDNWNGELIVMFDYLFTWLNVNTAERLATKGLLHHYLEDIVISIFGIDKEKTAELMKRSREQEKIIEKLERDAMADEEFRSDEKERQRRDS